MGSLDSFRMYLRFVSGLPAYLRKSITLEDAKAAVREGLAEREDNFLRILRRGVFGNPGSPYLPLMRLAGIELADVESAVRSEGLETTLEWLRAAGVHFTFEEFKGRQPVVRRGQEWTLDEHDFDNPHSATAYEGRTGGSTSGVGTRVETDLENLRGQVPHLMLVRHVHGLNRVPMAVWYGTFPDPTGVGIFLRAVAYRRRPVRWFTPITTRHFTPALKDRLATEYVLLASRMCGVPCPRPEPLPVERAAEIARWVSDTVREHGGCEVVTTVSLALRVCLAAEAEGIDISGASFMGGGEPYTAARRAVFERLSARYVSIFIAEDIGPMGLACPASDEAGVQHLLEDNLALIQYPREVPGSGVEVDAFYITTLRPTASKILLNVESDDYGIVEERRCGCELEGLGYRRHVRRIRSFGKLTGEGVTLVGSEMVRILEDVLPGRFGGTPQDFQLLEEEGEHGLARLKLLVSPEIAIERESDVVQTLLAAVGDSSVAGGLARVFWDQGDTITVERRKPIWTARGKLLPIRVAGLHTTSPTEPRRSS